MSGRTDIKPSDTLCGMGEASSESDLLLSSTLPPRGNADGDVLFSKIIPKPPQLLGNTFQESFGTRGDAKARLSASRAP